MGSDFLSTLENYLAEAEADDESYGAGIFIDDQNSNNRRNGQYSKSLALYKNRIHNNAATTVQKCSRKKITGTPLQSKQSSNIIQLLSKGKVKTAINDKTTINHTNKETKITKSQFFENPMHSLPKAVKACFEFSEFNKMQKEAFDPIYNSGLNCVVSSPTGSGKTILFELAILSLFAKEPNVEAYENMKALYIAPTKALCAQMFENWSKKFSALKLGVGLLTGDTSSFATETVKMSNIIIATPEKWDSLTRRWFDHNKLLGSIKLLLIDEVHILKDKRGAVLEVAVTRTKTMCKNVRIIALSATVPNVVDISKWLKKDNMSNGSVKTLVFDDSYRPTKLEKLVYGFKRNSSNQFQFDFSLNNKMMEIIKKKSKNKPVLIFCPTRKIASSTGKFIMDNIHTKSNVGPNIKIQDNEIKKFMMKGVACHHAGLSYKDRITIENCFINGSIRILCSTSTLAVGVNLPAYLVIIKGTKRWADNQFLEYSELDLLQMMGRAGRPQFEDEGIAVILTEESNKKKYERWAFGTENLESNLHLNLYEHLAAEIALKTVDSLDTAVHWLRSTFFYTRFKRNPEAYKELRGINATNLVERLTQFCEKQLKELVKYQIIKFDNESEKYTSTFYGDAMSRHYVLFETMKKYINCPTKLTLQSTFELLCCCSEFDDLKLKHNEKRLFSSIASSPLLMFPTTDDNTNKVNLLLQHELKGLEFPQNKGSSELYFAFNSDKLYVLKQCPRLVKCLVDTFIGKKDSVSLINALKLSRCIAGRCWEDTPMMLRQIEGIGLTYARKLISYNITTFEQLAELNASRIQYLTGMPLGKAEKVLRGAQSLPKLSLVCKINSQSISDDKTHVKVVFSVTAQCVNELKLYHSNPKMMMVNIVTDTNLGELLDFRRITTEKLEQPKTFSITARIRKKGQVIRCQISCDELTNCGCSVCLPLNIPSSYFDRLNVEIDSETYSDNFSDDEELEDLLINLTSENTDIPYGTTNASRRRPDDLYQCKHKCKDKTNCRHLCCQKGLQKVQRKRRASKDHLSRPQKQKKLHPETRKEILVKPKVVELKTTIVKSETDNEKPLPKVLCDILTSSEESDEDERANAIWSQNRKLFSQSETSISNNNTTINCYATNMKPLDKSASDVEI